MGTWSKQNQESLTPAKEISLNATHKKFAADDIWLDLPLENTIHGFSQLLKIWHVVHTKWPEQLFSKASFHSSCPSQILDSDRSSCKRTHHQYATFRLQCTRQWCGVAVAAVFFVFRTKYKVIDGVSFLSENSTGQAILGVLKPTRTVQHRSSYLLVPAASGGTWTVYRERLFAAAARAFCLHSAAWCRCGKPLVAWCGREWSTAAPFSLLHPR